MNKLNQNKKKIGKGEKLTKDTIVILASKSNARKQILKRYKINFKAVTHTIDEGKQKNKHKFYWYSMRASLLKSQKNLTIEHKYLKTEEIKQIILLNL